MEELKSRVAYLQGLSAGMELSPDSKEGRLLNGIIEVLGDFASSFGHLENAHGQLEDYLESIDEDLYTLEDEIYQDNDEGVEYMEVKCPRCGETVCFDPGIMDDDDVIEVTCPNCDEVVFVNDNNLEAADEPEAIEGRVGTAGEEEDDI